MSAATQNHLEKTIKAAEDYVGTSGATRIELDELVLKVRATQKTTGKDYRRLTRFAYGF